MYTRKYIFSTLLHCLMCFIFVFSFFALLSMKVHAAENSGSCGPNVNWHFDVQTGTLTIVGSGQVDNYTEAMKYTQPAQPWYEYKDQIINIVVTEGITSIGDFAFINSGNLENITLPDSLKYIGQKAFQNCHRMQNIYVSSIAGWLGITFADDLACPMAPADQLYVNNELVTVLDIPEGVTQVPNYAFKNYKHLTEIKLPSSVKAIGASAFLWCENLQKISFAEGLERIEERAFSNCRALTDFTLPDSLVSIGGGAFSECYQITTLTIPKNILLLAGSAFRDCNNLREANLPDSITEILGGTFEGCNKLESVKLPANLTSIGATAFMDCSNLDQIFFPNTLQAIGDSAFNGCPIRYLDLPDSITQIGYHSFSATKIKYVYLPKDIVSLHKLAFEHCKDLEHIYYGGTNDSWENHQPSANQSAIVHCDATKDSVTITNAEPFSYHCSFCSMSFIDGISGICGPDLRWQFDEQTGVLTISGTGPMILDTILDPSGNLSYKIRPIIIEEGVTSIDEQCFQYIRYLQYAKLPSSLTNVGDGLFGGCEALHHILFTGTEDQWSRLCINLLHLKQELMIHYEAGDCQILINDSKEDYFCSVCNAKHTTIIACITGVVIILAICIIIIYRRKRKTMY